MKSADTHAKTKWFNNIHLQHHRRITVQDMQGVSLPHAGTKYCGHVLSHALRFVPPTLPHKIVLTYEPATEAPDAADERPRIVPDEHAFHEVVVPVKALLHLWPELSSLHVTWSFVNARKQAHPKTIGRVDFLVVSADWTHFYTLHRAMSIENHAAAALAFGKPTSEAGRRAIDAPRAFLAAPANTYWRWIGRSFSPGTTKPVGYMSFLLMRHTAPRVKPAWGYFVTGYDAAFRVRECLGKTGNPTRKDLAALIERVRREGGRRSPRLNATLHASPIVYLLLTELHDTVPADGVFVRGYHSVMACNATYISNVFLEHTSEQGNWVGTDDRVWPYRPHAESTTRGWSFDETLARLHKKGGKPCAKPKLFASRVLPIKPD